MKSPRAFTLIELLVSISVLAVLLVLLLPALTKVREDSKDTNCLSNVRQLVVGEMNYVQDFDQNFTSAGHWIWGLRTLNNHPSNKTRDYSVDGQQVNKGVDFRPHDVDYTTREAPFYGTLEPYIDNMNAHFCPLAGRLPVRDKLKFGHKPIDTEVQRSYVQNWNVGPIWQEVNKYKQFDYMRYHEIANSSDMVVIGEENTFTMGNKISGGAFMNDGAMGYSWDNYASFHHLETESLRSGDSAAGFADGSADWIFPQARVTYRQSNGSMRTVNATEAWSSDDIPNPEIGDKDITLTALNAPYE